MRKGDEDWVKKCMEYRVEGRRPVGRPRKTWLESVEADMAKLEIDKIKGRVYASCVRNSTTYENETMPLLVNVGLKCEIAEMQMIRWMNNKRLQTTQPASGGAVTNCCANCVEPSHLQQWGARFTVFDKLAMRTRWMAGAASHKSG